jgi:hypothetical protein
MNSRLLLAALTVSTAMLAHDAQAVNYWCNQHQGAAPGTHSQCADSHTGTGNGVPQTVQPDQVGSGPVSAAQTNAGSGTFAAVGSASASAGPGLLRASASAESLNAVKPADGISFAYASAAADASFFDWLTVQGPVTGSPVSLRFTLAVDGAFAGGPFGELAEGIAGLSVFLDDRLVLRRGGVLNASQDDLFDIADLTGLQVGDSIGVLMTLRASAYATNERGPRYMQAKADLGHTGRLFVDVLSGDATVASHSGHRYASGAVSPVPEPSATALLAAGGLCILVAARRRRSLGRADRR